MSVRAASGMAARRLVARTCATWRYAFRGATEGVIGPVVSVTMTSSGLRAGDSTASPRARVGKWRVVGRGGRRTGAVFGLGCHAVWRLGQPR
jgi:hypothetical protein